MKLSKTQRALLAAMEKGVRVIYMRYSGRMNPHPYYFRCDTYARCTAAADALLKKGLAKRIKEDGFGAHELAAVFVDQSTK